MAERETDLIKLFKLSSTEANHLGLQKDEKHRDLNSAVEPREGPDDSPPHGPRSAPSQPPVEEEDGRIHPGDERPQPSVHHSERRGQAAANGTSHSSAARDNTPFVDDIESFVDQWALSQTPSTPGPSKPTPPTSPRDGQRPDDLPPPTSPQEDDPDLIRLFGLSPDEVNGLGISMPESPHEPHLQERPEPLPPQTTHAPSLIYPADLADVDQPLLDAFAEESAELLTSLHVELEHLEQDMTDRGALLEIRRAIHTLKGGAAMCGFSRVAALTHACENILDLIADDKIPLTPPALEILFSCQPLLHSALQDALAGTGETDVAALDGMTARINALYETLQQGSTTVPEIATVPPLSLDVREREIDRSPKVTAPDLESPHLDPLPKGENRSQEATSIDEESPSLPSHAIGGRQNVRRGIHSITVDVAKVDAVVAKVTEMSAHRTTYQNMMAQLLETTEESRRNAARLRALAVHIGSDEARGRDESDVDNGQRNAKATHIHGEQVAYRALVQQLQEAVSDQQALVQRVHDTITMHWRLSSTESRADAELQNALLSIRLIPIASLRVRLDGTVRQTAVATGKEVRWQLHGGSVAVEKNVFDRLFEPLMHLLRNAIDHGLETSKERQQRGKTSTGTVIVSARQENNSILINVQDDGGGIVPQRIAQIAAKRGIITHDRIATMTDDEKLDLIFTPGFSTATSISHVSGRGVGMDAVRESCAKMGGTLSVQSEIGVGTTVQLRVPLSLSLSRGLIVRDRGHLYAVPVAQINALYLVPLDDVTETPDGLVAHLEELEIPLFILPVHPGARSGTYVHKEEIHVMHVMQGHAPIGIILEDILDEEEILVKAPPPLLHQLTTILGAFTLPNGDVVPVLNMPQICSMARPALPFDLYKPDRVQHGRTALVADDSMSIRQALTTTLQSAGFTVTTARNGQEALELLQQDGLPSLVTLDVEMPSMDGLETLFAIRHLPEGEELPVFMMTSRGGASYRRAAAQLGATRFFTKPYRDSELIAAAHEACNVQG